MSDTLPEGGAAQAPGRRRRGGRLSRRTLSAVRAQRFLREKRFAVWLAGLGLRVLLRRLFRPASDCDVRRVRMVSILSMPRTGSTLAKRYLGGFARVDIAPLQSFEESLRQARSAPAATILLDKKTDNIKRLHQIVPRSGCDVAFICLVRDPRDELVSLCEFDRHRPVPRDARFWPYWTHRYARALTVLRRLAALGIPIALLRYEDLAQKPVAVKRAFAGWLGLDLDSVDDAYEGGPADESLSRREDWKAHRHSRVHGTSVGRWNDADGGVAEAIAALDRYPPARRLMRRLGYLPAYEPLDPRRFPHITLLAPARA